MREELPAAQSAFALPLPFNLLYLLYFAGLSLMIINICMQMERESGEETERERGARERARTRDITCTLWFSLSQT